MSKPTIAEVVSDLERRVELLRTSAGRNFDLGFMNMAKTDSTEAVGIQGAIDQIKKASDYNG